MLVAGRVHQQVGAAEERVFKGRGDGEEEEDRGGRCCGWKTGGDGVGGRVEGNGGGGEGEAFAQGEEGLVVGDVWRVVGVVAS